MYLRWTVFPLRPGNRAQVEEILRPFHAQLAAQPGFRSARLGFDAAASRFVSATCWDSHAEAEAITRVVRDRAHQDLGELLDGEPMTEYFEVYEPDLGSPPSA